MKKIAASDMAVAKKTYLPATIIRWLMHIMCPQPLQPNETGINQEPMKAAYKMRSSFLSIGILGILPALLIFCGSLHAQSTPSLALKSNMVYDLTGGINLGMEFKTDPRSTLEVPIVYNPFSFGNGKKWRHMLLQPELRLWRCEAFNGHFFGLHAHYAYYNVGGIGSRWMKGYRFEGWLAGAGISYGYQWILSPRWSLEASIGVGYAYMDYDRYQCRKCGELQAREKTNYFGPTKLAMTLVYVIK